MNLDNLNINSQVCLETGILAEDAIVLYLLDKKVDLEYSTAVLIANGYVKKVKDKYVVTKYGQELLKTVIDKSAFKNEINEERVIKLAYILKELFPRGLKEDTTCYWRGTEKETCRALYILLSIYDISDEDIIISTNKYLNNFITDKTFMKTLPRFIWCDGSSKLIEVYENEIKSKNGKD